MKPMICPHCDEDMKWDVRLGPIEAIESHMIWCKAFGGSGVPLPMSIREFPHCGCDREGCAHDPNGPYVEVR